MWINQKFACSTKIAFSKYFYIRRLKKSHLISSFTMKLKKKKIEKKVAPEYMPIFTEIDHFFMNWWHTKCLQTSRRTEKWTDHFHSLQTKHYTPTKLKHPTEYQYTHVYVVYVLIHVSDLISMNKVLPYYYW